jgi:hypothetical protein
MHPLPPLPGIILLSLLAIGMLALIIGYAIAAWRAGRDR